MRGVEPIGMPAIVLFDGLCNLCDGTVRFIIDRDPTGRFRFAPLQSDVATATFARIRAGAPRIDSIMLIEGDTIYQRSDAILRIAELLGRPWSLAARFRFVPRAIRDAVYRFIARNRYTVFGVRTTCRLPTPSERARFL